MQNDVCAEFDTGGLFSHSSAEGGNFVLTLNLSYRYVSTSMICDITTSLQANPSAHTLIVNFTVNKETSCVQQLNFLNEIYLHIY